MSKPSSTFDRWFNLALVAGYAGVVLALVPFHEPWRDEAQSWLIARDLPLPGIIAQMGYEGTPALWHLLQMPPAKLGLPYESLGLLNALCAIGAVAVVAWAGPFARWQKIAFAFSYFMLFEYGAVWRCYSLSVLALMLTAWAWTHRRRKPVLLALAVTLLSQINLQATGIAALLTLAYGFDLWRQKRRADAGNIPEAEKPGPCDPTLNRVPGGMARRLSAGVLMFAAVGLAALQLRPPADAIYQGVAQATYWDGLPFILRQAFLPDTQTFQARIAAQHPVILGVLGVGLLLVMWELRRTPLALTVLTLGWLGWSYVFVFKTPASTRHAGLFIMLAVFALWLARGESRESEKDHSRRRGNFRGGLAGWVVFGALLLSVPHAARQTLRDFREPFSGSREMGRYLREHPVAGDVASFNSNRVSAVLPYVPGLKPYWLETRRFATFSTLTPAYKASEVMDEREVLQRSAAAFPAHRNWLLLTIELHDPTAAGYRLVYRTTGQPFGHGSTEKFWLYAPLTPTESPRSQPAAR